MMRDNGKCGQGKLSLKTFQPQLRSVFTVGVKGSSCRVTSRTRLSFELHHFCRHAPRGEEIGVDHAWKPGDQLRGSASWSGLLHKDERSRNERRVCMFWGRALQDFGGLGMRRWGGQWKTTQGFLTGQTLPRRRR